MCCILLMNVSGFTFSFLRVIRVFFITRSVMLMMIFNCLMFVCSVLNNGVGVVFLEKCFMELFVLISVYVIICDESDFVLSEFSWFVVAIVFLIVWFMNYGNVGSVYLCFVSLLSKFFVSIFVFVCVVIVFLFSVKRFVARIVRVSFTFTCVLLFVV